jgi:GTP cyclohydrolase IA
MAKSSRGFRRGLPLQPTRPSNPGPQLLQERDQCRVDLVRPLLLRPVAAALQQHQGVPQVGTAHVGYLPGARILGLSKLARVVEHFACRPQVQERLTKQVADWLQTHLEPKGVGVVIEAEHSCMTLRGV